jgi:hypothetical protein
MVGHGHSRLIKRFNLLHERLDLICAVQETELGVEVEMNEGRSHGGILGGQGRRSQTHEGELARITHDDSSRNGGVARDKREERDSRDV